MGKGIGGNAMWAVMLATVVPLLVGVAAPASASVARPGVISLSAGNAQTCAVRTSGKVWCWGANGHGQLGDGTHQERSSPVRVVTQNGPLTKAIAVAAGFEHTCAVRTVGDVWCWGDDYSGQVGDGTTGDAHGRRTKAVRVTLANGDALLHVKAVSAGYLHTCALRTDTSVWCWGADHRGQVGDGEPAMYGHLILRPVQVRQGTGFLTGVTAISLGGDYSCAIRSGASMWCWGDDRDGQLGDGTQGGSTGARVRATQVRDGSGGYLTGARSMATGDDSACAVLHDRTARCWGDDYDGEIGDGTRGNADYLRLHPVEVIKGSGTFQHIRSMGAGSKTVCAVRTSGDVWCWGDDADGQAGDATFGDPNGLRLSAVKVQFVLRAGVTLDVRSVAVGGSHVCALMGSGAVWCWGLDRQGQVGDGTHGDHGHRLQPVRVTFLG